MLTSSLRGLHPLASRTQSPRSSQRIQIQTETLRAQRALRSANLRSPPASTSNAELAELAENPDSNRNSACSARSAFRRGGPHHHRGADAGNASAKYSPLYAPPLTATTMYCLPFNE